MLPTQTIQELEYAGWTQGQIAILLRLGKCWPEHQLSPAKLRWLNRQLAMTEEYRDRAARSNALAWRTRR
jgi:hypothetical protein